MIQKSQVQIGKGLASNIGKMIDDYFGKIIIIEFIFSLWGFLEVGLPAMVPDVDFDPISNLVSISGVLIILGIFLIMLLKKKE